MFGCCESVRKMIFSEEMSNWVWWGILVMHLGNSFLVGRGLGVFDWWENLRKLRFYGKMRVGF